MDYDQIRTFLTIASYRNITAAANHLYLSQSTVSNRVIALEEELGVRLFIRNKGQRNLELTSHGNAFIAIAEQWASLYKDTQALKNKADIHPLTIAAVDAVNTYTFTGLYNEIIDDLPSLKLQIQTHHSNEIHGLVENRSADIGFFFSRIQYPSIISRPVFRELMYLVCQKDSRYYNGMPCEELAMEDEVYLNWGPDHEQWHHQYWNDEHYPLITVNTGNMLQHCLHKKDRWAIAPMSVIQAIKGDDLVYYTLKDSPPPRICYELTSRYPAVAHMEGIDLFNRHMSDYIRRNAFICEFEDWMLKK